MIWRACRKTHVLVRPRTSLFNASKFWYSTSAAACRVETQIEDLSAPVSVDSAAQTASNVALPSVRHGTFLGAEESLRFIAQHTDVKLSGLVRSIRKQKRAAFAHISDGTTLAPIQVVLEPQLAKDVTNGAYVEFIGRWQPSPKSGQSYEFHASAVDVQGPSDADTYPIQKKYQSPEYLRSLPHLRLRTPLYSLLTRARAQVIGDIGRFFQQPEYLDFLQVQPPLITSSDCEGAGEAFTIWPHSQSLTLPSPDSPATQPDHYFKEPKWLTVSSQLHLEAFAAELGNVWTLSPTFRAEQSDTARHLSEFYMFEAEQRGVATLDPVMDFVESLIRFVAQSLLDSPSGHDLVDYFAKQAAGTADETIGTGRRVLACQQPKRWTRISYTNAISELCEVANGDLSLFRYIPCWDKGLQLEHEKWIVENIGGGRPVFVTDYPKRLKPFYMLHSPSSGESAGQNPRAAGANSDAHDRTTVACFDLLFPFGTCEIAGGSLREHRLKQLIQNMREKGMLKPKRPCSLSSPSVSHPSNTALDTTAYPFLLPNEDLGSLKWYADLRRYGSSPHGGFGMGFDRLLAYLTGTKNVRDVVAFPRSWYEANC